MEKWAALDVPRHLWHFTRKGIESLLKNKDFILIKSYPLFFDAFYIAYISEKTKWNNFSFFKSILIGIASNIKAFFSQEHSSLIYVF